MFHLSRFQLALIFVSLLILRVVVGFHFFKEGTTKLKHGFTAQPFFASANGPLVPLFNSMLDDPDGRVKLCLKTDPESAGALATLDPELSYLIWDDFLDKTTGYFGFGSPDLIEQINERRTDMKQQISDAQVAGESREMAELQRQWEVDTQSVQAISQQPVKAEAVFENHKLLLAEFLDVNRAEIVSHFAGSRRLQGFAKDGEQREQVAQFVDSLRGQVDTIASDRKKKLRQWSGEVEAIWDSYEQQINGLAVDAQSERSPFRLDRPYSQTNSSLKMIDRVIPWFDTIVGALLILGLFSRLASGAAAVFLLSVIATQPPWIPGSAPTYFFFIELAACLVLFATAAGRFGGLDYFFSRRTRRSRPSPVQS